MYAIACRCLSHAGRLDDPGACGGAGQCLEPPRGAGDHQDAEGGRHGLLHVQQLRAGADRLRDLPGQLRAAAGRLRRPQLLHPRPRRGLPHPRRQRRQRRRVDDLRVPGQADLQEHLTAGRRQDGIGAVRQRRADQRRARRRRRPERRGELHAARADRAARQPDGSGLCHRRRDRPHPFRQADRQHRQQVGAELPRLRRQLHPHHPHPRLFLDRPGVRGPASRRLRRQPRRGVRPGQHREPPGQPRRGAQHPGRQERHHLRSRGAGRLPGVVA